MRYFTLNEVLETYRRVVQQTSGVVGIHDLRALESAVAQSRVSFGGGNISKPKTD
jgi:death on curing protein